MSTRLFSCFVEGLEASLIEVEVDILQGLPGLSIVGLGDAAVQEAKERIRSAIKNSGVTYPQQKKVINLAPAHLRKNGACFDVPMALGLLEASGQIKIPKNVMVVGELALNGEIRPINGALSVAIFAKNQQMELFLPAANAEEAKLINYPKIFAAEKLSDLVEHFRGTKSLAQLPVSNSRRTSPDTAAEVPPPAPDIDMNTIQGQHAAKRALEISAAGGHHLLFFGPPGTGKTLLAHALQGILPPLTPDELLQVLQIYSTAGLLKNPRSFPRPFRRVHQSCSLPALVGGGSHAQPGEISLAHQGVLFFDEIAEAPRHLLESLRQPLEEKLITISRASRHVTYPANFTFVAAMNPCPCGYYGNHEKQCTCPNSAIVQYHKKLSGPLMDRFDLFLELNREPVRIQTSPEGQSSAEFLQQITKARRTQCTRYQQENFTLNSLIPPALIPKYCQMDDETIQKATQIANTTKLSMRGFHNILKVARTVADLNAHETIESADVSEAFQYRVQPTSPLV